MGDGGNRAGPSRGGGTRTPDLRFWRPPLYQLSYAPGWSADCIGAFPRYPPRVAAPSQHRALGALFAVLAAVLAAVAAAALLGAGGSAARWVIALAALALAGWLGSLALSAFRHR